MASYHENTVWELNQLLRNDCSCQISPKYDILSVPVLLLSLRNAWFEVRRFSLVDSTRKDSVGQPSTKNPEPIYVALI
jgi:hypothetical protein